MDTLSTGSQKLIDALNTQLRAEIAASPDKSISTAALALGIERATLSRYLNGKRQMPMPVFVGVCEHLGISPLVVLERARDRMEQAE